MALDPRLYTLVRTEENYPDKSVIMKEGAHGDWVYVVLEGRVKVQRKTEKGHLTLATLKEGAVFGEFMLLQNQRAARTASVVSDGPVIVGVLDVNRLESELGKLSPMLRKLLATLATRLEEATIKLVNFASR
jgi:CRP-like cAMP-binding protein